MFVEQPVASPGSAYNALPIFAFAKQKPKVKTCLFSLEQTNCLLLTGEGNLCSRPLEHFLISGNPQYSTLLICSTRLTGQRDPGSQAAHPEEPARDPQSFTLFSLSFYHYMKVQVILLCVDPRGIKFPHLSSIMFIVKQQNISGLKKCWETFR